MLERHLCDRCKHRGDCPVPEIVESSAVLERCRDLLPDYVKTEALVSVVKCERFDPAPSTTRTF